MEPGGRWRCPPTTSGEGAHWPPRTPCLLFPRPREQDAAIACSTPRRSPSGLRVAEVLDGGDELVGVAGGELVAPAAGGADVEAGADASNAELDFAGEAEACVWRDDFSQSLN